MKSTHLAFPLICAMALAPVFAQTTVSNGLKNYPYDFAMIGDQPYTPNVAPGTIQNYQPYLNLIGDINANKKVEFTVHIGDIKRGTTLCADNVYTENLFMFNQFANPFVYLPGDNEWTDCHRANNGGYNPVERLAVIRNTFFNSTQSLGLKTMTIDRQSNQAGAPTAHCPATPDPLAFPDALKPAGCQFRENVMWTYGVVLFVGLNQPGSNNNRGRTKSIFQDGANAEYAARNLANMAWLDQAFNVAAADPTIKGVMVMNQANPFERFLEPPAASNDSQVYAASGYADLIKKLRDRTVALGKPVVFVNGDTHYFRVDKPLLTVYPGCAGATAGSWDLNPCTAVAIPATLLPGMRIMNSTRLEVFGDVDAHWVRVSVDPNDPNLFSFSPQRVPGN